MWISLLLLAFSPLKCFICGEMSIPSNSKECGVLAWNCCKFNSANSLVVVSSFLHLFNVMLLASQFGRVIEAWRITIKEKEKVCTTSSELWCIDIVGSLHCPCFLNQDEHIVDSSLSLFFIL